MRATIMHAAGDVRIERVPDPTIMELTNALDESSIVSWISTECLAATAT
jgi:hypothetical protein